MILNTLNAAINENETSQKGGSLAKVVWFSKTENAPGGRLNFVKFETQKIDECVSFIRGVLEDGSSHIPKAKRMIKATGGGAHKYYDLFKEQLGVSVHKEDEMECLITGLNFLNREIPGNVLIESKKCQCIYEA
ncbi:hypothetical protein HDU67_002822 [Dinochytrium kinnereticum]|nr:hypothetical protein HDU67_002822 [Dinochytrium kinnereticum]